MLLLFPQCFRNFVVRQNLVLHIPVVLRVWERKLLKNIVGKGETTLSNMVRNKCLYIYMVTVENIIGGGGGERMKLLLRKRPIILPPKLSCHDLLQHSKWQLFGPMSKTDTSWNCFWEKDLSFCLLSFHVTTCSSIQNGSCLDQCPRLIPRQIKICDNCESAVEFEMTAISFLVKHFFRRYSLEFSLLIDRSIDWLIVWLIDCGWFTSLLKLFQVDSSRFKPVTSRSGVLHFTSGPRRTHLNIFMYPTNAAILSWR